MKNFYKLQDLMCYNGRIVSVGGSIEGILFDLKDFQKMLTLLSEEDENREDDSE